MNDQPQRRPFDRVGAHNAMPLSFPAFLGRFGALTAIQSAAMPVLLSGDDALIIAPAASGKTEAVMAPLCQRLSQDRPEAGRVGILYIVPTRALANDIEIRIHEPLSSMRMSIQVRTGDHPRPVGDRRLDVLVTTPESFDSLMCRVPAAFQDLRALVVDEAHLVDNTARGDQLRILLRRVLMKKTSRRPQLVAMSATVGDPEGLAGRLFGGVDQIIADTNARQMDAVVVESLNEALASLRADGLTKAIIFCNTRRRTEQTAAEAVKIGPWPAERIMVHHASLPRREREDVEKAFRYWETGLMICTSTMELGVDIGDVDAVVLADPPDSVASLQQRVGRGCRRRSGMRAVFVAGDPASRSAVSGLMADVDARHIPVTDYEPDISVIVQQTFSLLFEHARGLPRRAIKRLLEVLADGQTIDLVLDHLRGEGFLEEGASEILRASPKLMDMGAAGRIHSNIADAGTVKVVDSGTGRVVGMLSRGTVEGRSVTIGGRSWMVTSSASGAVSVKASAASDHESGTFFGGSGGNGAFFRYLPPELRGMT